MHPLYRRHTFSLFSSPLLTGPFLTVIFWCLTFTQLSAQGSAIPVLTSMPKQEDLVRTLQVAGEVMPFEKITVYSRVTGFVESISVDRGSLVKKGDLLLKLWIPEMDDQRRLLEIGKSQAQLEAKIAEAKVRELEALVEAAKSQHAATKAQLRAREQTLKYHQTTFERYRNLIADNSVTPQELDLSEASFLEAQAARETASAEVVVAGAAVNSADQALERSRLETKWSYEKIRQAEAALAEQDTMIEYGLIRAPFDGVVTERRIHTGSLVIGGGKNSPTPLLLMMRTDKLRIVAHIPETEVASIATGTPAKVTGVGISGKPIEASVTLLAGAVTSSSKTMPIEIHSSDARLIPGLSVYVILDLETHKNVLTVPSHVLQFDENKQAYVWTVDDGKARRQLVNVGYNDLIRAEVNGITSATRIIVGSRGNLENGKAVTVEGEGGSPN